MLFSALRVLLGAAALVAAVQPDLEQQQAEEQTADYLPPPFQLVQTPTAAPLLHQITPAPEAPVLDLKRAPEKRAGTGNPFIGWFSSSNYWYSWTCPPGAYFGADPTFGACCASTSDACLYATACDGRTALAQGGAKGDCGTQLCDTITIFNSVDVAETGVRSLIGCFESSNFYRVPRSFYRNTFALTTQGTTEISTTTSTPRPTTAVKTTTMIQRITVTPSPDAAPGSRTSDGGGLFWVVLVPVLAALFGALLV